MAKRTPQPCTPKNCGRWQVKCGTVSTYTNHKCRCEPCCEAWRAYNRERKAAIQPCNFGACVPENCGKLFPKCGKYTTYTKQKCRCDACKSAASSYSKQAAKRNPKPAPRNFGACSPANCGDVYIVCGTASTYTNKNCRCDECRQANNKSLVDYNARNPEKARMHQHTRKANKYAALTIPYNADALAQKYEYWGDTCHIKGSGCRGIVEAVEHVIPIKKGGPNILANIRPACHPCNNSKKDKWPYAIRYIPGGKVA
jgi:hypothetical protein